ncbi:MAG: monofunctional biosynthetic peptidoglycan transglycosylase [Chitinophagaceae bacterium]|nr:monofunctional biosynthetic peptidoglycan transglycosylase [Chitinophagaceae bacterium]
MLRIIKKVFFFLLISHLAYILLIRFVDPPITITQITSIIEGNGFKRTHLSLDEMSKAAKLAVIASEDQLFPDHNGFDIKGIERALAFNKKKKGKKIRGASTISQQVAKNVFLWQGRSWFRKGLEVYFTFMIELVWSKQRILEVYLNEAEMGKGIFGIEAAAKKYFKKPASKLTRTEAAMIAASLPNPVRYSVKPASTYVSRKYPWVLRQMNNLDGDPDILKIIR